MNTIDKIIQDWDNWNKQQNWGGIFFNKVLYPDPKGKWGIHNNEFSYYYSILAYSWTKYGIIHRLAEKIKM